MANNEDKNSFSDEILKLAQCVMPEPPTTKVKRMVAEIADKGIDRQLHEIGWKAYDTVVGAAHAATGRVLVSPTVGQILGGAIDITRRWPARSSPRCGPRLACRRPARSRRCAATCVRCVRNCMTPLPSANRERI